MSELALGLAGRAPDTTQERRGAGSAAAVDWVPICPIESLIPGRGVAGVVGDVQVAIFLLAPGEVCAVDQRDPFSGADVLSRGIVGDVDGEPTVASPVYKQRFALRSGQCLEDPTTSIRTWPVRVDAGLVEVLVR